jgi:hypothetical protein
MAEIPLLEVDPRLPILEAVVRLGDLLSGVDETFLINIFEFYVC